jgi:uncharacterized repeat protein (TIGR04076 family)
MGKPSIKCPGCGRKYDKEIFEFQKSIICEKCGTLIIVETENDEMFVVGGSAFDEMSLTMGRLIIEVSAIKGTCPVFSVGDKIILDEGYRMNLEETDGVCMHALASVLPYYNSIYNGISAATLGLASQNSPDKQVAYVQCLDPCEITGGGTVTFRIKRGEKEIETSS